MKIYPLLTILVVLSFFGLFLFQLFSNPSTYEFKEKKLIPFDSNLLNGDPYTSDDLKNDSLSLLNVWATWCVGCRLEHTYLMELERKGITIIGINYKDEKEKAFKWLDQFGNPYQKNVFDDQGEIGFLLGVSGAPETFAIKDGNSIVMHHVGVLDDKVWKSKFAPLFEK
tara:strand:+ start:1116 stop:1622 length:507 start_codon:yes stop_codon:yes gene_type:complete